MPGPISSTMPEAWASRAGRAVPSSPAAIVLSDLMPQSLRFMSFAVRHEDIPIRSQNFPKMRSTSLALLETSFVCLWKIAISRRISNAPSILMSCRYGFFDRLLQTISGYDEERQRFQVGL